MDSLKLADELHVGRRLSWRIASALYYCTAQLTEIENALIDKFKGIKQTMEEEILRRHKQLKGDPDSVLISLLNIERRAIQAE